MTLSWARRTVALLRRFQKNVVLVLGACVALAWASFAAAAPQVNAQFNVYVPFSMKAGNATPPQPTPVPPGQPTPVPPAGADGAFFFETNTKTASANVVVDAQGGTHTAYYYYISENDGGANVVYSYCPAPATNCVKESGWQRLRLFGPVSEVQLQVTADGKPRLLAGNQKVGNYGGLFMEYTYAECNQNCLQAANWRSVKVDAVRGGYLPEPRETPRRSFALDHQGHPYFVASDNGSTVNDESRYGSFLYGCQANCTDAANWTYTRFTAKQPDSDYSDKVYNPVLTFTSTNQPRVIGEFYPAFSDYGYVTKIRYFACDAACDQEENWGSAAITPRGNGPNPSWDLAIDSQNRAHAVVYHQETTDDRSKRLFYFVCNSNCTSEAAWTPVNLGLPENVGLGANVEVDAAGNPRVAHLASNGILVYSWCNGGCSDTAKWLHAIAEKPEDLDASKAVVIPSGCVPGIWDNYGVSLTLDPQGNPRMSYDATYQAQCPHTPPPGTPPTAGFYEIAHMIRMYFSPKP